MGNQIYFKIAGQVISTWCTFLQFKLNIYLLQFLKYNTKCIKIKKKIDRRAEPPHIFGREPSNDYFIKILFLLSKWFQTRRFLWELPIASYVKLSSAVAVILVCVLKCRTQFWKRTTQESFQQNLVEIGSLVSEEKIFFKCHPPFFLFLAWWPSVKIGKSSKFIKNPVIYVKKLIIMLIQFKFGYFLA